MRVLTQLPPLPQAAYQCSLQRAGPSAACRRPAASPSGRSAAAPHWGWLKTVHCPGSYVRACERSRPPPTTTVPSPSLCGTHDTVDCVVRSALHLSNNNVSNTTGQCRLLGRA